MNKQIKFIDLGMMDYKDAWDYQQKLFDEIIEIKKKNRKNNSELIITYSKSKKTHYRKRKKDTLSTD